MLAFNVAQLLKEGVGAMRHYPLSGELGAIDENNPGPAPVEGEAHLVRTLRGILAQGAVRTRLVQSCRRCLELSESEVELEIEEEFIPSIDIETGATLPLTDDDEPDLVIDEHHILDFSDILRQLATATLLAPSLCREDCRGLCPNCGANLNNETCTCERPPTDPRLALLGQLLQGRAGDAQTD